ncbi:hypothetical protein FQA39_LY08408 [Lamprigera yunnana]|nr:hypothetical protein FQA39_LY08408 [Lamprigera yunnana]
MDNKKYENSRKNNLENKSTLTSIQDTRKENVLHPRNVNAKRPQCFPIKKLKNKRCDSGVKWFNVNLIRLRKRQLLFNGLYAKYGACGLHDIKKYLNAPCKREINLAKTAANDRFIQESPNPIGAMWKCFPIKKLKNKRCDSGVKWFNVNLIRLRKRQLLFNGLYAKYGACGLHDIKKYLNAPCKREINLAKTAANDRFIQESPNPIGAMWKVINSHRET